MLLSTYSLYSSSTKSYKIVVEAIDSRGRIIHIDKVVPIQ